MEHGTSKVSEQFRILWTDTNANKDDSLLTQQRLYHYFNCVEIFDDKEQCQEFIRTNVQLPIILIISGQLSESMVPFVKDLEHVKGVFIFCYNIQKYEELAKTQRKILGVFGQLDELTKKIKIFLRQYGSGEKSADTILSGSISSLEAIVGNLKLGTNDHTGSETPLSPKKSCFLDEVENVELVSLENAIASLKSIVRNIEHMFWTAASVYSNTTDGLTADESSSIYLYTMPWVPKEISFGYILDEVLRSQDKEKIKPWLFYLKLIFTALSKLPNVSCVVFQGKNTNLIKDYPVNRKFVTWEFCICKSSVKTFEDDPDFGKTGDRTLFTIETLTGKNITKHALESSTEQILLLPGREFQVVSSINPGNGLHIIQLRELPTSYSFT